MELPKVEGAADIPKALKAIIDAIATGEITPGEGQSLTAIVEAYRKGAELADIETRLSALEERYAKH